MRSRRGQRSRRWAVALVPLFVGACASSTATEISIAGEQPGTNVSDAQPTASTETAPGLELEPAVTTTSTPAPAVTTTSTTLVPQCTGLPNATSGEMTFVHDEVVRTYRLALPSGYDGTRFAPMVVNFHSPGGDAEQHDENTAMSSIATKRGFIVVTPNAIGTPVTWHVRAGDSRDEDFAFIEELVAELKTRLCVDVDRVFAAGHANGGVFAAFLVCSPPYHVFSAIAMVSGGMVSFCPDDVQPAMIQIAGTADEKYPYVDDTGGGLGAVEVAKSWATRDGCADKPLIGQLVEDVQQMAFVDCAQGDVVLLTVLGGTHPWPGGVNAAYDDENSEAGKTFNATDAILDFFEGHLGA